MLLYAQIVDPSTCKCNVGVGDPNEELSRSVDPLTGEVTIRYVRNFYEECGLLLMDVEEAYDGSWYLAGHAPVPPVVRIVRTFAKDAIWVATRDMTLPDGRSVWNAFKDFLVGADLWEGWNQQAYLLEENPFYAEFYPRAVAVFGQELVDSVLNSAVVSSRRVTE
jgi:hypothetical protein